jgi:hypothetical protein
MPEAAHISRLGQYRPGQERAYNPVARSATRNAEAG